MNVLAKLYMYKIVQMVLGFGMGRRTDIYDRTVQRTHAEASYDVTLVSMYHHNPEVHLPLDMLDKRIKFITLGKHKGRTLKYFCSIVTCLQN